MGKRKTPTTSGEKRLIKPAESPEAREEQLVALAYNLVEQRLLDGTATSQETTHFLKIGSQRAKLESEKLRNETELLIAKAEAVRSGKVIEELYSEAIKAMKTYSGQDTEETDDQDIF